MLDHSPDFTNRDAIVRVSDSAVLHLMLAGMESFRVRHWGKHVRENTEYPVEANGILFGYSVQKDNADHFIVEHASTDKFAKGYASWVERWNETVNNEKRNVICGQWPHLQIIGDFHTHPYTTYTQAETDHGWEFSPTDIEFHEELDPSYWEGRCALVLTIAELKRLHKNKQRSNETWEENVIHWQLGGFRYWLSAIVLDETHDDDADRFIVSPRRDIKDVLTRPAVYLKVPTIHGVTPIS